MLNPVIFNVSTRGSADTIISALILQTIYFLLKKKFVLAAITYGLCVHFKIYPILYSIPFYLYIDRPMKLEKRAFFENFFSKNRIIFTTISAGIFILLFLLFYYIYGDIFV